MTPLRQRFIDDLRLKNFSDGTIKVYVRAVEKFARFLGRSPDESTAEDVRAFMIHQLDRGLSRAVLSASATTASWPTDTEMNDFRSAEICWA